MGACRLLVLYLLQLCVQLQLLLLWDEPDGYFISKARSLHERSLRTSCGTEQGLAAESNFTGLRVIVPSLGKTGTTSLHHALCAMGLRSFHAEERALYAQTTFRDGVTADELARSISRCRIDAIFLEPTTDIFPQILERSPGAKVIMNWRNHNSWASSLLASMPHEAKLWVKLVDTMIMSSLAAFPWESAYDLLSGGQVTRMFQEAAPMGCPGEGTILQFMFAMLHFGYWRPENKVNERGVFKTMIWEEAVLAHRNEVRKLTPPGRYLDFKLREHGWAELEEFLGVPAPRGVPFPHTRKAFTSRGDNALELTHPFEYYTALAICAAVHVVNILLLRCILLTAAGSARLGWGIVWGPKK